MSENKDPRITRAHIIHEARVEQIALNLLAVAGGRPYIDARLHQMPYESDASWSGRGEEGFGRLDRAFLINDAGRVVSKINQFVFSTEVQRLNVDPTFLADTTRTGTPINGFMARVSELVTAARWCWISVDRDSLPRDARGQPVRRSVAAKEASGDRVFWSAWAPTEVVDWSFDRSGKLRWLITEQSVYENEDYTEPAACKQVRTIWRRGGGIRLWIDPDDKDKEKIILEEPFNTTLDDVGFIPVGTPSADAWWFDDIEGIQNSLLNLYSVHVENLVHSVFPQLIISEGMLESVESKLQVSSSTAIEIVRGLNYPIIEAIEANGQTRYITPNASDLKAIPDEIMRLRRLLYERAGLALSQLPDTRQVSSAESKAWDHLDPEAVLKERAQLLEESEKKAVELSQRLDNTFAPYTPVYGKTFNVRNPAEDMLTLLDLGKLDLPPAARKEIQRAGVDVLDRLTGVPDDRKKQILAAIDSASATDGSVKDGKPETVG